MKRVNRKTFDFIKYNLNKLILTVAFWLCLGLGTACAPLQVLSPSTQQSLSSLEQNLGGAYIFSESKLNDSVYKPFPMDYNGYIKKWLNHYSKGDGYNTMRRYLERSNRYLNYMGDIFTKQGLPKELVYVSMAESGFWPYAKSTANAVGYWQFIRTTGQSYNLQIDPYVDDRQDFFSSTKAASEYLKDLYAVFKDWRLSMAAYNCGEACVKNAIRKHNSKNFWYLVSEKALPEETREHVPKIIAMARISLDPEAHGFYDLSYRQPLDYQLVSIQRDSSLSSIANYLRVPYQEIKSLNPKFKTDRVPAYDDGSYIRIPRYIQN